MKYQVDSNIKMIFEKFSFSCSYFSIFHLSTSHETCPITHHFLSVINIISYMCLPFIYTHLPVGGFVLLFSIWIRLKIWKGDIHTSRLPKSNLSINLISHLLHFQLPVEETSTSSYMCAEGKVHSKAAAKYLYFPSWSCRLPADFDVVQHFLIQPKRSGICAQYHTQQLVSFHISISLLLFMKSLIFSEVNYWLFHLLSRLFLFGYWVVQTTRRDK